MDFCVKGLAVIASTGFKGGNRWVLSLNRDIVSHVSEIAAVLYSNKELQLSVVLAVLL